MIRTWPALFKGLGRLAVAWRATCLIFLKLGGRAEESNPSAFTLPGFQDRLPTIQRRPPWSRWLDSDQLRPVLQTGAYPLRLHLRTWCAAGDLNSHLTGFKPAASAVERAALKLGAPRRIRTSTVPILNRPPLPLGYRRLAPRERLERSTSALTARRSAIELPGKKLWWVSLELNQQC